MAANRPSSWWLEGVTTAGPNRAVSHSFLGLPGFYIRCHPRSFTIGLHIDPQSTRRILI